MWRLSICLTFSFICPRRISPRSCDCDSGSCDCDSFIAWLISSSHWCYGEPSDGSSEVRGQRSVWGSRIQSGCGRVMVTLGVTCLVVCVCVCVCVCVWVRVCVCVCLQVWFHFVINQYWIKLSNTFKVFEMVRWVNTKLNSMKTTYTNKQTYESIVISDDRFVCLDANVSHFGKHNKVFLFPHQQF